MLSDSENKNILRKLRKDRKLFQKQDPWYRKFSWKQFVSKKASESQKTTVRKRPTPKPSKRRQVITNVAASSILAIVLFWSITPLLRRSPPTYVPNAELNQRLDSLFTAINSQDDFNTDKIQSDLKKMASKNNSVDADTLDYIKSLCDLTKRGEWAAAAEKLHKFITQSPN